MNKTSLWQQLILNAIPVVGYWFWNWSMFSIVYLYWMEAVIISVFVFLRIAMARGRAPFEVRPPGWLARLVSGIKVLLLRMAILAFYWVFILIFVALGQGRYSTQESIDNISIIVFMHPGFNLTVLAFFLSQIIEFMRSFIYSGDYLKNHSESYKTFFDARTIIIHIVIILGTFSYQFLEKYASLDNRLPGLGFVVILFLMKSVSDMIFQTGVVKQSEV
jgi:hypothetical protein